MRAFLWATASLALCAGLQAGQGQTLPVGGAFSQAGLQSGPVLVGRVVEAGTSNGIGGAELTLEPRLVLTPAAATLKASQGGRRRLMSDGGGNFAFTDLAAGSYTLSVSATGYIERAPQQAHVVHSLHLSTVPLVFDLDDKDRPATITIPMSKLGCIAGVVRGEGAEPLVGVPVSVVPRVQDRTVFHRLTTVLTDDRGQYHADVLPGNYVVAVLVPTTTRPVTADFGGAAATSLGPGGVSRAPGAIIGRSIVTQWTASYATAVPPLFNNSTKSFVYPSTYYLSDSESSTASAIRIGSGEERYGIDLDLKAAPARRMSGQVTYAGTPVPNILLRLVAADVSSVRPASLATYDSAQAWTDDKGEFSIIGAQPGSYRVCVGSSASAQTFSQNALVAPEQVTMGVSDLAGVHIRLQQGSRIAGFVRLESQSSAVPIRNLTATAITLRPLHGCMPVGDGSAASIRAMDNGEFRTEPIVAGFYAISVSGLPEGWILKSVTSKGIDVADRAFEVPRHGIDDLTVTLTDRQSVLSGAVRRSSSQVGEMVVVGAFPAERALWPQAGVGSRRVQIAFPARSGRYSFQGLPAGEYYVVAVDDGRIDFSDPVWLASLMTVATRVRVADGDRRIQDISVMPTRKH